MNCRLPLVLFFLVAGVFLPSLGNGFVAYDDFIYVLENPLITSPRAGAALLSAWTMPYEQNFTPLLWTSFRALHSVFGESPLPFHFLSVLLHATNAVLVFFLGRKLGARPSIAAFASLLWALHPQRVEAVSWVSALKDPASTVFALACTWIWLEARERRASRAWWIGCAVALALSLLFKQAAVPLPFVLYGCHLLSREKNSPLLFWQHLPLLLLGLAGAMAAMWANHDAFRHSVYLGFGSPFAQPLHFLSALAFTVSKAVIPLGLLPDYPVPVSKNALAGLGLLIAVTWIVALGRSIRKGRHPLTLGLLWAGALWLPASGLVSTPLEFTADRLTYLPSSLLIPVLLISCQSYFRGKWQWLLVPLIIAFGLLTIRQQFHWRSAETLIGHCLRVNERHYPSLLNDAVLRLQGGEDPAGPIRSLENAIGFYPFRSAAYHKLIQVHRILGNHKQADDLSSVWRTRCAYDPVSMEPLAPSRRE